MSDDTGGKGGGRPDSSDGKGNGNSDGRDQRPWWEDPDLQRRRLAQQVRVILDAVPKAAVFPPGSPEDMEYLYVEGDLLVRDVDLPRVRATVPGRVVDSVINGVSLYRPYGHSTTAALERIEREHGLGVAMPNHIHYVTPAASCCPATEPLPTGTTEPDPAAVRPGSGYGAGAFVSVVDTGFIPDLVDPAHYWLEGVTGDAEFVDPNDIGLYVGHGTFVAGVVRGVASDAEVHVHGFLTHGGAITEVNLIRQLDRAIGDMPDVISMSAGCTTRHNLPPIGFLALWEHRLRHCKGTVLVAAAGNNKTRSPFWPAAFPWTVSVGALDRDGNRAPYSDFGSWVDVYALGSDVVNAYPNGTYRDKETPNVGTVHQFQNGMAMWSGTSFSTPLVAGMIAARLSQTGESGRQAADSILRIARSHAVAGIGAIADETMTFEP
jgi:subtilisin family serine protease